jgi:ParB family chromosome partitioning protein
MNLEHHQLEIRYEDLRVRRPSKERQVLSSLATHGQQVPIVVVSAGEDGRYVVVDGHKRLRALKKLGQDVVQATVWDMGEAEALLLVRAMRSSESESALEQG